MVRARMSALRWSAGSESFGSLCSVRGEGDQGGWKEEGKRVKMRERCGERSGKGDG